MCTGLVLAACGQGAGSGAGSGAGADSSLPRIVQKDGRHQMIVDGKPFLMLAVQANNSSNYPAMLPDVWAGTKAMHANVLQMPIAWEQVEPVEGQFDFSFVDTLLTQARQNKVRLVLLWFGAYKNTSPTYTPDWVKQDKARFPHAITADGKTHYTLSVWAQATYEADKRAFVRLMEHLKARDPQHTVIMVQVENETGAYGIVRDHSPQANALFAQPVPEAIAKALGKPAGTWSQVFGADAEENFQTWGMSRYVGGLAQAGRAVKNLPMYANAALRDPIDPQPPGAYATGGPTHNMLDMWKAAAPALDLLAPDIYIRNNHRKYMAALGHYARKDNPLFVAETGNDIDYARFFFATLGKGAIGFSPFGMDTTGYSNYPLGAKAVTPELMAQYGANYALFAPFASEWARLAFETEVWGAARPDDSGPQTLSLGSYDAKIEYGQWQFGFADWTWLGPIDKPDPAARSNAGAVIARLGPDSFLVTGRHARVSFAPAGDLAGRNLILVSVEEVQFVDGAWKTIRRWNGDQIDYGLNLTDRNQVLKVTLATH